jgi:hypothetical protein
MMLSEIGDERPDGSKVLSGREYEIKLTFGASNYFDPERVRQFRGALLREACFKGLLAEIFVGTMNYSFSARAEQVLGDLPPPFA